MKNTKSKTQSGGIGFLSLLTIVFITLKLTNYIDWSWWYVLMPIYVIPAVALVIALASSLLLLIIKIFETKVGK